MVGAFRSPGNSTQENKKMRALTIAIAAAATLISAGAASADTRVSDSQFLAVARCTGLAQGSGGDTAAGYESFYKEQGKRRSSFIYEQAEKARAKARHSAKIANDSQRNVFAEELAGTCRALKG